MRLVNSGLRAMRRPRRPPRHSRRWEPAPDPPANTGPESGPLAALLNRTAVTQVEVGRRPLSVYDELTGTRPFTTKPSTRETS